MEYYLVIKKNEIMPFAAAWMDLEIVIQSEVKSDREIQISYDITYMWNLKYDTNEPIYETETESGHREQTGGCQRGGSWGRVDGGGRLGLEDVSFYI